MINKLDELEDSTMLMIESSGYDLQCMRKDDFLESAWYIDGSTCTVSIAEATYAEFSLEDTVSRMEEECSMHEEWTDHVLYCLEDKPEIFKTFEIEFNKVLKESPTYWESYNIVYQKGEE